MSIDKINPVSPALLVKNQNNSLEKMPGLHEGETESAVSVATEGFSTAVRLALSEKPIPNLPDIEALQKDVQQGHYQVDYEALADKLIELDGLWYR